MIEINKEMTTKQKGDAGEKIVASLLRKRGYKVTHIGGSYPVVDITVATGARDFCVSVKSSLYADRIRLGGQRSLGKLEDNDYLFALFPPPGKDRIKSGKGGFQLLIIPGERAREDGLHVHETYRGSKGYSVMIKGYSQRKEQVEVWTRWWNCYRCAWHLLPAQQTPASTSQ